MTKIKINPIIPNLAGYIKGTVFSKNASGSYMKNKVKGKYTRSRRKAVVHNRFAIVQNLLWYSSGLNFASYDTRLAAYVAIGFVDGSRPYYDIDLIFKVNKNALEAEFPVCVNLPNPIEMPILTMPSIIIKVISGVIVSIDLELLQDITGFNLWLGSAPGSSFVRTIEYKKIQRIAVFVGAATNIYDVLPAYLFYHNPPLINSNVYFKAKLVAYNGQHTEFLFLKAVWDIS